MFEQDPLFRMGSWFTATSFGERAQGGKIVRLSQRPSVAQIHAPDYIYLDRRLLDCVNDPGSARGRLFSPVVMSMIAIANDGVQ